MLFNSIEFALFLPIVFLLYWFVFDYALKRCKKQLLLQNLFIVIVSYIFYGWWDWRFLVLIAFTSLCSYCSGLLIARSRKRTGIPSAGKGFMILNLIINLAILIIFKYYDFFVVSFSHLFDVNPNGLLIKVILPVGISFYTFQALSYSIDVYRGKIVPTTNIVAFFAYVSFFPQLVAGPIERATNLLPQFLQKRSFNSTLAIDGMRQILWGLFKKIVIADNCAIYVDEVFNTYSTQSGSTLLLSAILFTFQIYCDFSGYSDIAIGTSKLFGIRLMRNFNVPYFSRDIAEFWRRWHISLTTWFRDYLYIPLGGSRPTIPLECKHPDAYKKWIIVRNTFIIFLVSGLWHGANWTFITWGAYHAVLFLPLILSGKNRKYLDQANLKDIPKILLTFIFVVFGWIIFRANSITEAWEYMAHIFSGSLLSIPWLKTRSYYISTLVSIALLIVVEWLTRTKEHPLQAHIKPRILRWLIYYALIIAIFVLQPSGDVQFIYFQF